MVQNRIDGCIAVQAAQSERETEFLLKLASRHNFIKAVVGWVNLNDHNVEDRLEYFSRNSFLRGIRHTVYDEKGEFLTDPGFQNGIAKLQQFNLVYDLLVFEYQMPGAIKLVEDFPNQVFVLDHMGKPEISLKGPSPSWKQNVEKISQNANVFCKLSGMFTQVQDYKWKNIDFTPYLDVAVEAFGVNWVMFGSDWPVTLTAASYEDTLGILGKYFSKFSAEDKERVFGANAVNCYALNLTQ